MKNSGSVTLKQIAERAGCSVTAVSKTLNDARGNAGVGEEMRRRVLEIAQELGYTPNYHARALQQRKSDTLGLVCSFREGPHPENDFWGQLIQGVERRTRTANHDLLIIGPGAEMSEIQRGVYHLQQKRIDALIVPEPMYSAHLQQLDGVELPIILVASMGSESHPTIGIDIGPGIEEAIRRLAALGHREMLWIPEVSEGLITEPERDAAVRTSALQCGLGVETFPLDVDIISDRDSVEVFIEGCRRQFGLFLAGNTHHAHPSPLWSGARGKVKIPSAVLAYNERIAIGICSALTDAGLRVPGDVSVIGVDNIYAHVTVPPLTVVSLSLHALGERAAELAIQIAGDMEHPYSWYRGYHEWVPTTLVERQSTGPPHPER